MKFGFLENTGSLGTLLTAAACPGCWPLFIPLGNALGLGFLLPFEGIMMDYVFPPFVIIALIGSYISFRSHRAYYPLVVTALSVLLVFIGFFNGMILLPMYVGIFGVLIGSILGIMAKKPLKIKNAEQG